MSQSSASDGPMVHVAILGGGPGGIGPLVRAARIGKLNALLQLGVAIFDKQTADKYGNGSLGSYVISSNTSASAFVNHFMREVAGESSDLFDPIMNSPLIKEIEAYHHATCPLNLAGRVFALAAGRLRDAISKWNSCSMHFETTVESVTLHDDGSLAVRAKAADNTITTVRAHNVVMAMGGQQGLNLVDPPLRKRTMTGLEVLTIPGVNALRNKLRNAKSRRVLIVGGSHTAFSVVWACLNRVCYDHDDPTKALWNWKRGDIMIVHRSKIRLYYNSAAEAKRDGYTEIDDGSTSSSGRINPFSGLRGDAKALYREILKGSEKRVQLIKIATDSSASPIGKGALWKSLLQGVEAVVLAIGMQTNKVPVLRPDGSEVAMLMDGQGMQKSDERGRLLMSDGTACPNIFGIGVGHSQPANASQVGGEKRDSMRRADGVRMYVQLYGHIILSNLINLPPTDDFPESPLPRKHDGAQLPLVAVQPASLSSSHRSDKEALCAVAKLERIATADSTARSPGKLNSKSATPAKPDTAKPLTSPRNLSPTTGPSTSSPKPQSAKPPKLSIGSPKPQSAKPGSVSPITPQPPTRSSRTRQQAWKEQPLKGSKGSPSRPVSVKLGSRVSNRPEHVRTSISKPIPPSVKLALPPSKLISPTVVTPGFTTPSSRNKRIIPLTSKDSQRKQTSDSSKVTIDTSFARDKSVHSIRSPNGTSSNPRSNNGERFEAIALRGAVKKVYSSTPSSVPTGDNNARGASKSMYSSAPSSVPTGDNNAEAATLPPLAGSAQISRTDSALSVKTSPRNGRGLSAVLGLRGVNGSNESTPKRSVQPRRTCAPSKMLPSVRQTGKYARQHQIVKHAL